MKVAVFGWLIICCVLQHEAACKNNKEKHSSKRTYQEKDYTLIDSVKFGEKEDAKGWTNKSQKEELHHRENLHVINLKQKRSLNSYTEFSCCGYVKPISKKDVLVRNPQKVHFAKKIIVGEQFRKLLKALYRGHPKAAQAINGKFQLSAGGSKEEDEEEDKVKTSNIEDRSDVAKNKTIIELRGAILKLLDKLRKKAKFPQGTKQKHKVNKHEVTHKLPKISNFSKTADTTYNTMASSVDDEISAKSANELDLHNFITRMKTMEGIRDDDSLKRKMFQSMNGMEMNGLNGITNERNMLSPSSSPMPEMYAQQGQNNFLPRNGVEEMNLAEQRRRIEDQMDNHLSRLQMNFKLLQQQQEAAPMQNPQNDQIAPGLQSSIATPPTGTIPFGFEEKPMINQAQLLHELNPYLPMNRPIPRFRTRLPLLPPQNPILRYPMTNEDISDSVDDDDDEDDDRDRDEPPVHYPAHEDEDADDEDDEEEHYGPEDER